MTAGGLKKTTKKKLSSANNPWAAAWVGGASDNSLPADTGKMLAE
jgi:hypothetical protein